jgi:hypothetical protein
MEIEVYGYKEEKMEMAENMLQMSDWTRMRKWHESESRRQGRRREQTIIHNVPHLFSCTYPLSNPQYY